MPLYTPTPLAIVNVAMGLIGGPLAASLSPPTNPHDKYLAANYPTWKLTQLSERDWRFTIVRRQLTLISPEIEDVDKPYLYAVPGDMVRPLRSPIEGAVNRDWELRNEGFYAPTDTLTIEYVKEVTEVDFPPAFVQVLATFIAVMSVEHVTGSERAASRADRAFKEALGSAARQNAFIIPGEDQIYPDNTGYSFISDRW